MKIRPINQIAPLMKMYSTPKQYVTGLVVCPMAYTELNKKYRQAAFLLSSGVAGNNTDANFA